MGDNKDKLIRYFEASGAGEQARRMIDLADQVVAGKPFRVFDFIPGFAWNPLVATKGQNVSVSPLWTKISRARWTWVSKPLR